MGMFSDRLMDAEERARESTADGLTIEKMMAQVKPRGRDFFDRCVVLSNEIADLKERASQHTIALEMAVMDFIETNQDQFEKCVVFMGHPHRSSLKEMLRMPSPPDNLYWFKGVFYVRKSVDDTYSIPIAAPVKTEHISGEIKNLFAIANCFGVKAG